MKYPIIIVQTGMLTDEKQKCNGFVFLSKNNEIDFNFEGYFEEFDDSKSSFSLILEIDENEYNYFEVSLIPDKSLESFEVSNDRQDYYELKSFLLKEKLLLNMKENKNNTNKVKI